jgi:hypothetical protein
VSHSFGTIPRSEIAGSYGRSISVLLSLPFLTLFQYYRFSLMSCFLDLSSNILLTFFDSYSSIKFPTASYLFINYSSKFLFFPNLYLLLCLIYLLISLAHSTSYWFQSVKTISTNNAVKIEVYYFQTT